MIAYEVLLFDNNPRSVIEVVYVALDETLGHVGGLLFCVWTMFFLSAVIYGFLVVGVFVCALDYPVTICDFTHFFYNNVKQPYRKIDV